MTSPEVSVIIVNYRTNALLLECLSSLYTTPTDLAFEVIVVDNASGDGTGSLVPRRFPELRLVVNGKNVGFARATNQGMALARGELLFWLNPDTIVLNGALAELAAFLRSHPDAGAVGPKLIGPDGSLQYSCRAFPSFSTVLFTRQSILRRLWPSNPLSRRYLLSDWDHAKVRAVDWLSGAALMTTRAVVNQVGPLDERFFLFNEDVDWCRRVKAAGYLVYYNPNAVVMHHIGVSDACLPARLIIERHKGMFHYYRKHMRLTPWLDLPILTALAFRTGVQLLTRSRWRMTR